MTDIRSTADMVARFNARRTPGDFDLWLTGDANGPAAQPGATQVYGFGCSISTDCPPAIAKRMAELAAAGLIWIWQRRTMRHDGDTRYPFDFLAVRTTKPLPASFPKLPRPPRQNAAAGRTIGQIGGGK